MIIFFLILSTYVFVLIFLANNTVFPLIVMIYDSLFEVSSFWLVS